MKRRLPSIHSLIAFEAVARNGGFTKASEELCLTHGAISHRIRSLEEFVSATLFLRAHNGASLTDEGIVLMESVGRALTLIESACIHKNARAASSSVTISVLPHFASAWLLARVRNFNELYPDIDLKIDASYELASFKGNRIDVAIRYGMGSWPGLTSIRILEEEVFPVCSPDYVAAQGPFSSPDELAKAILLRYTKEPWKPWFEEAGLSWSEPAKGPIYSDFGLLMDAAVLGHGIALGRSTIVENALESGRLIRLFSNGVRAAFSYYIVYPRHMSIRPEVLSFIEWLINSASVAKRAPVSSRQAPRAPRLRGPDAVPH